MKVCVEWWTALSAYVDNALPPDEREQVEAHLEQCAGCQEAVVHLQSLRRVVSLLPPQEPPPMLKARILSATVDQPTWTERLAMGWRRMAWRAALTTAVVLIAMFVWQFIPRQVPQMVSTLALRNPQSQPSAMPQRFSGSLSAQKQGGVASLNMGTRAVRRSVAQQPAAPAKTPSVKNEAKWSAVTRARITPAPAPTDALQGEPVMEEDVPHIDVNSPPAGTDNVIAEQPEEMEDSKTVATRFTLPAEVVPSPTQGLESLREQIRIRGAEQLKGQLERKIERKQVELDVIKVRF
ncbi:MAG: zf-HC2 domain-containing protein [Firmicutes bacterium]|nr:zf-HC2 domain-containing protein [Bacillota bacterium]